MLERADHWTPPDSLGYSSLRPVRLTGQGKALIGISAALVIGAIVLGVFLGGVTRRQAEEQRLLRDQGIAADATVTRAWIGDDKERQPWVAYRFDYGGNIYTRRVQTPTKIWQGLRAGSTIPVRFVPSQPSISHPIAWSTRALPFWLAWLLAGAGAAIALLVLIPLRRQSRLLAEGRPAPGRVTAIKHGDKVLVIKYEFRLLNGVVAKGRANASKAPAEGAILCVLYDPENPRCNALYPLSLVRLENAPSPRSKR
jgi:Protein of unknown function (DUF3592)